MILRELKEIERKDWHVLLLLSFSLVILSSFIGLIVFYTDVSRFFQERDAPALPVPSSGLL